MRGTDSIASSSMRWTLAVVLQLEVRRVEAFDGLPAAGHEHVDVDALDPGAEDGRLRGPRGGGSADHARQQGRQHRHSRASSRRRSSRSRAWRGFPTVYSQNDCGFGRRPAIASAASTTARAAIRLARELEGVRQAHGGGLRRRLQRVGGTELGERGFAPARVLVNAGQEQMGEVEHGVVAARGDHALQGRARGSSYYRAARAPGPGAAAPVERRVGGESTLQRAPRFVRGVRLRSAAAARASSHTWLPVMAQRRRGEATAVAATDS